MPKTIPIPEDALSGKAAGMLAETVIGWSGKPVRTPDEQLPGASEFTYGEGD